MKIQTLKEAVENNGVKCFVYGFAGVGKTPLILTLPGHGLIINAEAGLRSMMDRPSNGTFDVVNIKSTKDMQEVHTFLESGEHNYQWAAIDSISEIAEVLISEEKKKTPDPRKAYGSLIDRMGPLLRAFRDLPMDIYMVGKAVKVKEEDTGRVTVEISIPGSKVGPSIPYLFDELFLMTTVVDKETGESTAWLQTKSDARAVCRDRSGRLDAFEPADLKHVLEKIKAPKIAA